MPTRCPIRRSEGTGRKGKRGWKKKKKTTPIPLDDRIRRTLLFKISLSQFLLSFVHRLNHDNARRCDREKIKVPTMDKKTAAVLEFLAKERVAVSANPAAQQLYQSLEDYYERRCVSGAA
jgi:hypothetical protein